MREVSGKGRPQFSLARLAVLGRGGNDEVHPLAGVSTDAVRDPGRSLSPPHSKSNLSEEGHEFQAAMDGDVCGDDRNPLCASLGGSRASDQRGPRWNSNG